MTDRRAAAGLVVLMLLAPVPAAAQGSVGPGVARPASVATAVTEFEVNGLKVLVKRRVSSQTVVAP